jgi:hypothetical protein
LEQITQLAVELYGYEINSSTILEMQKGCYERLEATEAEIKERLKEQAVVHFDETGIRAQGKLHWLHTASTEHYTHLFVNEKRGQQALLSDDSVIKEFRGIAVHDCWASYFLFLSCAHALCGAHLLRELVGLAECGSQWALLMKAYLFGTVAYRSASGEPGSLARALSRHPGTRPFGGASATTWQTRPPQTIRWTMFTGSFTNPRKRGTGFRLKSRCPVYQQPSGTGHSMRQG